MEDRCCGKCNGRYEYEYVECFDGKKMSIYLRPDGRVMLKHKTTIETTNFNYCPYCGRKLRLVEENDENND